MTDDVDELKALLAKRDAQIVYLRAQLGLDADGVPIESYPSMTLHDLIRNGNEPLARFLGEILDNMSEITPGAVKRDWTIEELCAAIDAGEVQPLLPEHMDGGSSGCAV